MQNTVAIQFDSITFVRNEETILNDISGLFHTGAITTLLGPSGSGKTTLLKLLNGLLSPSKGQLLLLNKPIEQYDPITLRRTVGIALQDAPIIRGTVYDNLALSFTLQNETLNEAVARQALKDVHLSEDLLTRPAQDLSGGQRQRLSLARTLLMKPTILLLDEITSALDPKTTLEIETLVQTITKQKNLTTIWVTHDTKQALKVSDYTYLLNNGHIVFHGNSTDIHTTTNYAFQQFLAGGVIE